LSSNSLLSGVDNNELNISVTTFKGDDDDEDDEDDHHDVDVDDDEDDDRVGGVGAV